MKKFLSVILSLSLVVSPIQANVCSATDVVAVQRNVTELINKLPEKLRSPLYKLLQGDPTWNATDLSLNETETRMLNEFLGMLSTAADGVGMTELSEGETASGHSDLEDDVYEYPSGLRLINHQRHYNSNKSAKWRKECVTKHADFAGRVHAPFTLHGKLYADSVRGYFKVGARKCIVILILKELLKLNAHLVEMSRAEFAYAIDNAPLPLEMKQAYNMLVKCDYNMSSEDILDLCRPLWLQTFDCGNGSTELLIKDMDKVYDGVRKTRLGCTRSDDRMERRERESSVVSAVVFAVMVLLLPLALLLSRAVDAFIARLRKKIG